MLLLLHDVLADDRLFLLFLQAAVVEFADRERLLGGLGGDVLVDLRTLVPVHLHHLRVHRDVRLRLVRQLELQRVAQDRAGVELVHGGVLALLGGVVVHTLPALHGLLVFRQNLVPLLLELFGPLELGLEDTFLPGPLLLQLLQPPDLQFVEVVLLPQDVELLLHFDDQLVLEFFQFLLQLPPLLLVLRPQVGPLLVGVFLHQLVNPDFFLEFQFVELASKVQSLIDPLFKGHQLLLELEFLQPVGRLDLQILVGVTQSLLQCLRLIIRLLFERLPPVELGLLEMVVLLVELIAELIDRVFPFLPVVLNLAEVDLRTQDGLPLGDLGLQAADFLHEVLEPDVLLDLQAVVADQFQPLFDEGEDLDLLVGV